MFGLNIFKKNEYQILEKKCFCCKTKYSKDSLKKDDLYFNGSKRICDRCLDVIKNIRNEFTVKYGKMSSSDKLFLSANLYSFVKQMGVSDRKFLK